MAGLCSDAEVMKYFPSALSIDETEQLLTILVKHYGEYGYTYYAVDELMPGKLIGLIGLKKQTYKAHFNPSVDIGWRLARKYWGKGYATEGATACLKHGIEELSIPEIVAVAPAVNLASISVMRKIGMKYSGTFEHPALVNSPRLKPCVLYKASAGR